MQKILSCSKWFIKNMESHGIIKEGSSGMSMRKKESLFIEAYI